MATNAYLQAEMYTTLKGKIARFTEFSELADMKCLYLKFRDRLYIERSTGPLLVGFILIIYYLYIGCPGKRCPFFNWSLSLHIQSYNFFGTIRIQRTASLKGI